MSTAFHPQTDGLTEKINQAIQVYLRADCNFKQIVWAKMLHRAESTYNN